MLAKHGFISVGKLKHAANRRIFQIIVNQPAQIRHVFGYHVNIAALAAQAFDHSFKAGLALYKFVRIRDVAVRNFHELLDVFQRENQCAWRAKFSQDGLYLRH